MELQKVVDTLGKAIVKDKLAVAAFSPQQLGIGRLKGTILAQLADGSFVRVKVVITVPDTEESES